MDEMRITSAPRPPASPPAGGAVYGLGFIGALVWFWGRAYGSAEQAGAFLKAIVRPAFLLHDAFKALQR
jgi:hypothetical protein